MAWCYLEIWARLDQIGGYGRMTETKYLSLPSRPLNGCDPSSSSDEGCGMTTSFPSPPLRYSKLGSISQYFALYLAPAAFDDDKILR
jgi:hypothetical protein